MSELGQRILKSRALGYTRRLNENKDEEIRVNEDESRDRYEEYMRRMRDNETYEMIDAYCDNYGYKLGSATAKNGRIEIVIRAAEKYHPDIYFDHTEFGKVVNRFRIQTTSYGALELEEYEKFVNGCQDSYELVLALNKIDLSTLYDPSVDYPDEE